MHKNCTLRKKNVPNTWLHTCKYEMGYERDQTLNRVCACVLCKYSGGIMPIPLFAQPELQPHRKALCIQDAAAAKIHWGVNSKETLTARVCHAQVESTTQQRCLAKIVACVRRGRSCFETELTFHFERGPQPLAYYIFNIGQTYTFENRWAGLCSMRADKVIWQSVATAVMSQFNVQTELFTS